MRELIHLPISHKCNSTIISAYYKIKSKHSYEEYLSWMTNFLTIQDCMVVFVQPDQEYTIRTLRPPAYPTIIIPRLVESFLVSTLVTSKEWEKQEKMDPEPNIGHNWELFSVWNEKINMMKIVADSNPFSSSYFVWLDIGAVRHEGYRHQLMVRNIPKDKGVLMLTIDQFTNDELKLVDGKSVVDFSRVEYRDRIGAGTIGCDQESLNRYHRAYYNTLRTKMDKGWFIGKEQNILPTACLESDLCLLVKGSQGDWFRLQPWLRGELNDNYTRMDLIKK